MKDRGRDKAIETYQHDRIGLGFVRIAKGERGGGGAGRRIRKGTRQHPHTYGRTDRQSVGT